MDNNDLSIFVNNVKFNFRVGVILEYKNNILIEKGKKATHSVIPGGRVKTLEDTKNTLIREIQEEMHFDISKKDIKLQNVIENFFTSNDVKYHELFFVYRIKLDENDEIIKRDKKELINYDSDGNWYEFISINDIEKENIKPEIIKKIVKEDKFKNIVVRD